MGQDSKIPTKAKAPNHRGEMPCVIMPSGTTFTEPQLRDSEKQDFAKMESTQAYKDATPTQQQGLKAVENKILSASCGETQAFVDKTLGVKQGSSKAKPTTGFHP